MAVARRRFSLSRKPFALREAIAAHEAGHSVIAHALGQRVVRVVVKAETGYTAYRQRRLSRFRHAVIILAGTEAERVFAQGGYSGLAMVDTRKVERLGLPLMRIIDAVEQAESDVSQLRDKVLRVRDALLQSGRLDREAFIKAVEGE